MRTLNELIKANECCDHGEPDSRCEDCPYNGIGSCCLERENDALYYLKTIETTENLYHDAVNELSKWKNEDWKDRYLPLTWEELRTMKDKPVWWTHGEIGEWLTIYSIPKDDNDVIYATTCSGIECWIYKKDIDKYNYYKKELE